MHPLRSDVFAFRLLAYGLLAWLLARQQAPGALLAYTALAPVLAQLPWPRRLHRPLWCLEALALPVALSALALPVALAYLAAALALLGLAAVHGAPGLLAALPLLALPLWGPWLGAPGAMGALQGFWLLFAPLGAFAFLLLHRRWRRADAALRAYLPSALRRRPRTPRRSILDPWGVVLMADLSNYTGWLEARGAVPACELLHAFYGHAGGALAASGGAFDRFVGDGLLAYFVPHPGEPRYATVARALRCAQVLGAFSHGRDGPRLRQGLSAGPLRAVSLGAGATGRGFAVVGVAVVEAERLQGLAAPGALALTGSLAPYLSGALRRGAPGAWVRLKGLRRRRWVLHRALASTGPAVNFG